MKSRQTKVVRNRNLDFFKSASPQIHDQLSKARPVSKLVFDADGEPDIIVDGVSRYSGSAGNFAAKQLADYWIAPYRFFLLEPKPYAVKGQFFDTYTNRFLENFQDRARAADIEFLDQPRTRDAYFLIIFGVGLGQHIDELTSETNCRCVMLVEPNLDDFVHSLDVYDWPDLAERLNQKGVEISFVLDSDPGRIAGSVMAMLRLGNPCSVDGCFYFVHHETEVIYNAVETINREIIPAFAQIGHFYDQALMVQNAFAILRSGKEKVFSPRPAAQLDIPALIIGCGPSLDNAIPIIREHAEKAMIISSGSALLPLMEAGIRPDFHVESENIDILPILSQVTDRYEVSDICLVAASSVDPTILKHFNNVVYYFRPLLVPFPLFCESAEVCLPNPDPVVVNASLSFAQYMGFRDITFFGVDLGTKGSGPHHSTTSYHYIPGAMFASEDQRFDIPVPGNFGGKSFTSVGLFMAREHLALAVHAGPSGNRYQNCSDGALIEGVQPCQPQALSLPESSGDKVALARELIDGFPVYTRKQFDKAWDEAGLIAEVDRFITEITEQVGQAWPFNDKTYLKKLMVVLKPGLDQNSILSERRQNAVLLMFQGTIIMMMSVFEYFLNRVDNGDKTDEFASIGREELTQALGHLRTLATDLIKDPLGAGPPQSDCLEALGLEILETPVIPGNTRRNAPCPCGSRKKYKHCHGAAA